LIEQAEVWLGRQDSNLRMPVPKSQGRLFLANRKPQESADLSIIIEAGFWSTEKRGTNWVPIFDRHLRFLPDEKRMPQIVRQFCFAWVIATMRDGLSRGFRPPP
jgi:hypothetical protein